MKSLLHACVEFIVNNKLYLEISSDGSDIPKRLDDKINNYKKKYFPTGFFDEEEADDFIYYDPDINKFIMSDNYKKNKCPNINNCIVIKEDIYYIFKKSNVPTIYNIIDTLFSLDALEVYINRNKFIIKKCLIVSKKDFSSVSKIYDLRF